jgi:hypothetical protein
MIAQCITDYGITPERQQALESEYERITDVLGDREAGKRAAGLEWIRN